MWTPCVVLGVPSFLLSFSLIYFLHILHTFSLELVLFQISVSAGPTGLQFSVPMLSLFTTLFVSSWNRAHYFPGGDPRLYSLYVGRVHRGSDIFFLSDNEVCLFVGHPCFFFPSRGQQQFQNDLIINLGKGYSPGSWLWKLERYLSYPTVPS